MTSVRGRRVLFSLLLLWATTVFAQPRPLNPIVRVLPRPTASVPAECEEGATQQPIQRVEREELTERDVSRDLEPPPSRDLRSQMQAAQSAAERNDRDAFRAALESAKALVASYPPGGERVAASDVIGVYNDLDRLGEYLFTAPTGAFFSASSELFASMTKYRGYEESMRPQALVDATGARFYPTRESMDFLVREAANRLTRLGFPPPPTRRAPTTTIARPTPAPAPAPAPRTSTAPPTTREPQPRTTVTERPAPKRHRTTSSRKPEPSPPATSTKAPPEEVPLPPPIVSATPTTTSASATEPTATEPTATKTTETTETTETTAAVTDTTTTQQQPPAKQRSVLLPLMLILIGAGVLILLFRASS